MKTVKNLQEGFTLVELMVVVAIIGILSAVAIPNFKKYQAKSKTSEAKLQLSSIYSAETAFMADADSYGTCLATMGYNPDAEKSARYYTTGFTAGFGTGSFNGITCVNTHADATNYFLAAKKVANTSAGVASLPTGAITGFPGTAATGCIVRADGGAFTAGAGGIIDTAKATDALADKWVVNENKFFKNTQTGY